MNRREEARARRRHDPGGQRAAISYDVSLLTRMLRIIRATNQQRAQNQNLRDSLVAATKRSEEDKDTGEQPEVRLKPTNQLSHLLQRPKKSTKTRVEERCLKHRIQELKQRNENYSRAKMRMEKRLSDIESEIEARKGEVSEASSALTDRVHSFSREKAKFERWKEIFAQNNRLNRKLENSLGECRRDLVLDLEKVFPIQNTTIRWVHLAPPDKAKVSSQQEMCMAVALGWTSQVTVLISFILDAPLRYPIRSFGSSSQIIDLLPRVESGSGGGDRGGGCEPVLYPLYAKGVEPAVIELATTLLNRNLSHFKWLLATTSKHHGSPLSNLKQIIEIIGTAGVTPSVKK